MTKIDANLAGHRYHRSDILDFTFVIPDSLQAKTFVFNKWVNPGNRAKPPVAVRWYSQN
jgi:hypothetical protein